MTAAEKRWKARFYGLIAMVAASGFVIGYAVGFVTGTSKAQQATLEATVEVLEEFNQVLTVEEKPTEPAYSPEELELLALVIYQEAGADACSDKTRQMVGEVALNRVESPRYPDTLRDVLLQPYQYGRLHWTGLVWPERAELPQEAHAVARAYDVAEGLLTGVVDRLLPSDAVYQAEFAQGTETLATADGFYFCK